MSAGRIQTATGWAPIRTIRPGEKIRENGAYALTIDQHHDPLICVGPSISSSGLRLIEQKTPAHFFDQWSCNLDRNVEPDYELESKESIRLGSSVHTLYFEPGEFPKRIAIRPSEFSDFKTKAAREWRDAQLEAGKVFLSDDDLARVHGMVSALENHPLTHHGILDGHIETSLVWKDEKTGIWLKSRPDVLPHGTNIMADLKCLRDVSPQAISRAVFEDARYDLQMALGGVGRRVVLGLPTEEYLLIAVESRRPHIIASRPIAPEELDDSFLVLRRCVDTFAKCLMDGEWPGYVDYDDAYIHRAPYARVRINDQKTAGKLPQEF